MSCESCQALPALFPIAGARAANTVKKITIATNVATTASEAQKFWISWLVQNEKQKILLSGMRIGLHFWLFLPCKKSASIAFWYQNAACRENPDPNAASGRSVDGQAKAKLETKHRRSHLLRGVGRVVPTCAVLQAARASVQVCATQTPRSPSVAV